MSASAYHVVSKEVKNPILRHNWIFIHTCCINNLHWQSSRIIFLCRYYFRYIGRLFLRCAFFVACCNIIRASWETNKEWRLSYRKKYIEKSEWGTLFFWLVDSFLCHLFLLSLSTPSPFPSDVLAEWPLSRFIILLWVIFCDDIMSERSKTWKSLKSLVI